MKNDIEALRLIIARLTSELEDRQAVDLSEFEPDAACGVELEGEPSEWLELATEIASAQTNVLRRIIQ